MITLKVLGINVAYTISNPKVDDIRARFELGATISEFGKGADVSATLNYADTVSGTPIGLVIVDGKQMVADDSKTAERDCLYQLPDKSLHIGALPRTPVLWALKGSPRLLLLGQKVVEQSVVRDQLHSSIWANGAKHLRIAHGLTIDNRLVIVRTYDAVDLDTLADIMLDLGCIDAINGDGGGSAYLYPADKGWGRKMGAALTIKRGDSNLTTPFKLIGDDNPELIIDAGHGGTDPGANGNDIIEKVLTLKTSIYQFARFKELGVKVALTRDSDITVGNVVRAALVKNSGAKFCISNHFNAATSASAQGVEVIHSQYSDGKLATMLMEAVSSAGQPKRANPVFSKRQADGQDWYYMHRWTGNVSTVIVEYGFLTNAADAARLKDKWETYAEAVVRAYCQFRGHKYAPPVVQKPATPISNEVKIVVDGKLLDQRGQLESNVTLVPVRAISEAFGAKVIWEQSSKTVYINKGAI